MSKLSAQTYSLAYKKAIAFVAFNDEPADFDFDSIRGYTTVQLISEAFNFPALAVATDILYLRRAANASA